MDDLKQKKILVFGTGAVGGYYGGKLVKAGYDVTFIARGKNHDILKQNGLTLIEESEKNVFPIKIHENSKELGHFDFILICTKARETKNVVKNIINNVSEKTQIASFQNGAENEEIIASVFGVDKTIGASLYVNSWLVDPGVVEVLGNYYITIGSLTTKETKEVKELGEIFKSSGIKSNISSDIVADIWNKLVWNAAVNPLSVLTKKTLDEILDDKDLYGLVRNILIEGRDVALANGINIRRDTVEYNLACVKNYKRGIITSTLQDYERGKPIEVEEIIGVIVRKANKVGMKVPNIEKVYNDLLKLVSVCV